MASGATVVRREEEAEDANLAWLPIGSESLIELLSSLG